MAKQNAGSFRRACVKEGAHTARQKIVRYVKPDEVDGKGRMAK